MGSFDDRQARVARATPQARTALLSASAERVLPVYEEYWVGDYSPAVARSVEIGWASALGEPVNADELKSCIAEVQDLVTYYYEEATRHEVLATAVTVVLRLLQSITPDEEASVLATARGIGSAVEAARAAEWTANWDTPEPVRTERAADEERAWQEAALARIETWTGPLTRTMFDDLGAKPPAWLLDWRDRTARYR
jgi:hypothetical protein